MFGGQLWMELVRSTGVHSWWLAASVSERLDAHPLTLSGGEQTLLAIASAGIGGVSGLAIDTALEQVDDALRTPVLRWLTSAINESKIVDHRLSISRASDLGIALEQIEPSREASNQHLAPDALRYGLEEPARPWHLTNLELGYAGSRLSVLQDVSLTLDAGVMYHVSGPNGSGKSTFAKALTGLIPARSGRIAYGGSADLPFASPGRLVAYHFQDPDAQLFSTSVREELETSTHDRDTASSAAIAFGLGHLLEAHPLDLPFLFRKRLALAVAFSMRRPWLILDEPTLGFDDTAVRAVASMTKAALHAGTGVLVISHDERFLEAISPSVQLQLGGRQLSMRTLPR